MRGLAEMSGMMKFIASWLRRWRVLWVDVLPGRRGRRTASVAAGAVPYKRAGRSKKKARAFRVAMDDVLTRFTEIKTRKSVRLLRSFPPVDVGLSESFRDRAAEFLGDLPRCPNPEHYDLVGPGKRIDVCVMGHVREDDDEREEAEGSPFDSDRVIRPRLPACGWWVGHFKTASLRTLRGRALRPLGGVNLTHKQMRRGYVPAARDPMMALAGVIKADYVFAPDEHPGEGFAAHRVVICAGGNDWKMIEPDGRIMGDVDEQRLAMYAYALDWGNRFLWTVTITSGPMSSRYHCSARNVLELLWMRDRCAGRRRRRAMIHLVRPHKRRLPSGKTTTVRPHLRGALECDWDAWRIKIEPSANDYDVLARRMLPGQSMLEFIEANCDELGGLERLSRAN